jgi:hypothetical protein
MAAPIGKAPRIWPAFYVTIVALYLLTSSGRIGGSDSLAMYNVTQSLVTNGSLSADPCTPGPQSNHCVPGIDGRNYAGFGLVPSIVVVPAYLAGLKAASLLHRDVHLIAGLVLSFYHVLMAAAVPVLLGLWLCRIGLSPRAALWTALLYAFADTAWGASKGFCSEPYFALGLVGCCYFLSADDRPLLLLAAGASYGFAVGSRINGAILGPAVLLYGLMLWKARGTTFPKMLRNTLLFGAPIAASLLLIAMSNQIRFGSISKTGYHLHFPTIAALLSTPLLTGAKGLLINSNVGILIYVPWVVMVPFLWRHFWNRYRAEAVLVLTILLSNFLFFAKYTDWGGGWAIGPRMLYAVIPFLTLPLAVLFDQGAAALRSVMGRATIALVSVSFLIQLILIPYPGSRYFQMELYNADHGLHAWWSGLPILEDVTAFPELLFGVDNLDNTPAHQHLLTFENPINLVRADLWLIKASSFGFPRAAWLFAFLLLLIASLGIRYTLGPSLRSAISQREIEERAQV